MRSIQAISLWLSSHILLALDYQLSQNQQQLQHPHPHYYPHHHQSINSSSAFIFGHHGHCCHRTPGSRWGGPSEHNAAPDAARDVAGTARCVGQLLRWWFCHVGTWRSHLEGWWDDPQFFATKMKWNWQLHLNVGSVNLNFHFCGWWW